MRKPRLREAKCLTQSHPASKQQKWGLMLSPYDSRFKAPFLIYLGLNQSRWRSLKILILVGRGKEEAMAAVSKGVAGQGAAAWYFPAELPGKKFSITEALTRIPGHMSFQAPPGSRNGRGLQLGGTQM